VFILNETQIATTADRIKIKGPTWIAWFGYLLGGLALFAFIDGGLIQQKVNLYDPNNVAIFVFGFGFGFVIVPWLAYHSWAYEVTPEYFAYAQWCPWRRIPWTQIRLVELHKDWNSFTFIVRLNDGVSRFIGAPFNPQVKPAWELVRRYAPDAVSNVEGFPSGPLR